MLNIYVSDLFNRYYMLLYYLQYYLSKFLLNNNNSSSLILFVVFFILGILTILSPCFISILPLSFSYLSSRDSSLRNILLFIFGILTSFVLLVGLTNTIGSYVFLTKLPLIFNLFLVVISLDLMNILNFSNIFSSLNPIINFSDNKSVIFQNYLAGLFIGLSVLPCNTSIFFIVIFLMKSMNNLLYFYSFIYFLGCVTPLLFIFSIKLPNVRFNSYSFLSISNLTSYISGAFLLIFSIFSILCKVFI